MDVKPLMFQPPHLSSAISHSQLLLLWQSIGCERPESFLWPRPELEKDIMLMVPAESSWKNNKPVGWYQGNYVV